MIRQRIAMRRAAERTMFAGIVSWVAALILRLRPLSWDELENFRATRWVGEGLVPYRDFWEHHTPVLWLIDGTIAHLLAPGAGTCAVITMRIVQLVAWTITFVLLFRIMKSAGVKRWASWLVLFTLLAASNFTLFAVEFRPDPVAEMFLVAGLAVVLLPRALSSRHWVAFGAFVSLAVLTNMRLVPLAIAAGGLMLIVKVEERSWGWNKKALWMLAGVAAMATIFVVWLHAAGAWPRFSEGMITYNVVSNKMLLEGIHGNFLAMLGNVPRTGDLAALCLLLLAVAGAARAWQDRRSVGPVQILTLLSVVEFVSISRLGASHPYHLQCLFLLIVVPAAAGLESRWRKPAALVLAAALLIDLSSIDFAGGLAQQNSLMLEVDHRTAKSDLVFDGVGYAIHRRPAYRYWFTPNGVVLMAKFKLIPPYGVRELVAHPPAAIIYTSRLESWFDDFPDLLPVIRRNYLPRQRALWIPALSGIVTPQRPTQEWVVLTGGTYRAHAIELLAKHPWFRDPIEYAERVGPDSVALAAPLNELPHVEEARVHWFINGQPGSTMMTLRRGDRVRVEASVTVPVGIVVVPPDVTTIFDSPGTRFHM